jgi:hypothetical protein
MTNREYIRQKLTAFGVTDAHLHDASAADIGLEDDFTTLNCREVWNVMCDLLEELLLAPRRTNVSESGFSISWDYDGAAKYYMWLCRRVPRRPSKEITELLGLSSIIDKTDTW